LLIPLFLGSDSSSGDNRATSAARPGKKSTTMPEGMNVEIAHKLAESESESDPDPKKRFRRWLIEVAEAIAVLTFAIFSSTNETLLTTPCRFDSARRLA
jgi:hypothetical protein